MSKNENVGRSNSIYLMIYDKTISSRCHAKSHLLCNKAIRIKKNQIEEKINELRKQYDVLSEDALRTEAIVILKRESQCRCYCHNVCHKENRK